MNKHHIYIYIMYIYMIIYVQYMYTLRAFGLHQLWPSLWTRRICRDMRGPQRISLLWVSAKKYLYCILYTYDHYYFAYHSLLLAKHFICAVRTKCCWWVVKSILRFCAGSNPLYNEPFSYSAIVWINSHFWTMGWKESIPWYQLAQTSSKIKWLSSKVGGRIHQHLLSVGHNMS